MIADDIAMIHLRQARGLAGSDTFAELLKHNQMAMRINGQAAFDDEFLRAAAKLYGSTSPAGQGFLAVAARAPATPQSTSRRHACDRSAFGLS